MMFKSGFLILAFGLTLCLPACKKPNASNSSYNLKLDSPLLAEATAYANHLPERAYNRGRHLDMKGQLALVLENPSVCSDNIRFYPLGSFDHLNNYFSKAQADGYVYTLLKATERSFLIITAFKLERGSDVILGVWQTRQGQGDLMICAP